MEHIDENFNKIYGINVKFYPKPDQELPRFETWFGTVKMLIRNLTKDLDSYHRLHISFVLFNHDLGVHYRLGANHMNIVERQIQVSPYKFGDGIYFPDLFSNSDVTWSFLHTNYLNVTDLKTLFQCGKEKKINFLIRFGKCIFYSHKGVLYKLNDHLQNVIDFDDIDLDAMWKQWMAKSLI